MEPVQSLPGGFISAVTRTGGTVRRTPGSNAVFVHELLEHLARAGWAGAPRFHGFDEQGQEVLDFVPGRSGVEPEVRARAGEDGSLVTLTRLVRTFHDLTAGTPLAGQQEVVCHHDLDPRNTVYQDQGGQLRPVALIDWDLAAPGRRVQDVARILWQFLPLAPEVTDIADTARRLRLVVDTYGLEDRDELMPTVLWWQERCWRGIATGAAVGESAMVALQSTGVVTAVRAAQMWTQDHRTALEAALAT
jgi:aminoglycoside phosphotransferase (APT) family kinase protein